jgi:hypothetical protein
MGEDWGIMKTLGTIGGLAVALAFSAHATTMVALDLAGLAKGSDTIVQGKVSRAEAKMSKDGARISTHVYVDVSDSLKGSAAKTVEVVQPGGIVGDIGQRVSGTSDLKVGDEVVVFLEKRGPAFRLYGMAQGCYRVERSTDGAAAFVTPDSEGDAMLVDAVTHAAVTKPHTAMKLDDFKAQVRQAIVAPPSSTLPQPPKNHVESAE